MCELAIDQERLRRPGRLVRCQDERSCAGNGNAAGLFDDTGQRKDTVRQLLYPAQVARLLIELGVRVGRRRPRAIAGAGR